MLRFTVHELLVCHWNSINTGTITDTAATQALKATHQLNNFNQSDILLNYEVLSPNPGSPCRCYCRYPLRRSIPSRGWHYGSSCQMQEDGRCVYEVAQIRAGANLLVKCKLSRQCCGGIACAMDKANGRMSCGGVPP